VSNYLAKVSVFQETLLKGMTFIYIALNVTEKRSCPVSSCYPE
jgi:hypothetical protein